MNKNLYGLMNWPDVEGIVYAECDKPKALLGGHICDKGFLVQVFRPDAVSVHLNIDGRKSSVSMEKVDEAGFFAALVSGKKKYKYTVTVELVSGEMVTYTDPYAIPDVTGERDYKAFLAGEEYNAEDLLGSHVKNIGGVDGVLFTVWAPEAVNVSLIGNFNKYDGRVNPMQRIADTGVFELFVPGLTAGCEYMYEVKTRNAGTVRKLDPMSRAVTSAPMTSSIVTEESVFQWTDGSWMQKRKKNAHNKCPLTVYEVSLKGWSAKTGKKDYESLAEDLAAYVKKQGYRYVDLMPVAEYLDENKNGYSTVAYYAPTSRYGAAECFKKMIDIFHNAGIGVLMDWNAAYFGSESKGLNNFDGTGTYGYLKPSLENNPDWDVYTFDYGKGAVRSFLLSNLFMWLDEYHIDGVRIDGVASMLYLDYGKMPSTWTPNIYGGNENLEAIAFIKEMNRLVSKRDDGVITVAEESSGWFGVTAADNTDCLGFTYKQNNCWKNDFMEFMCTDPLFRKGEDDKLTFGMLYNYGENFMLALSHDVFKSRSFENMVSGEDEKSHLADIRAALGFMYAHPGCKLLSMGQDIGLSDSFRTDDSYWLNYDNPQYRAMEKYIAELNKFYMKNEALYELDDNPDGFEWLDNSNAEETVIAFARTDKAGNKLTAVVNFTPVKREEYRLHVVQQGKYKEVFNSSLKKYGGDELTANEYIKSDDEDGWEFINVTIPGLSFVVYSCEPYTELELEEKNILKKAAIAKKEAEQRARDAEELKKQAEEQAIRAIEAEKEAQRARKEALKIKEEAVKKVEEALKASEAIEIETRKKLELLEKKNCTKVK